MKARPILRYFGGKFLLRDWIMSHFPQHRVYTEVFGGAASVLMGKPRSKIEVYNDLDRQIFNLFRVLRDRGDELRAKIELTPYARDEYLLSGEPSSCDLEQARRTMIKSWFSIGTDSIHKDGSGFRCTTDELKTGKIPVHQWANYPAQLKAISDRLRGVLIENDKAAAVLLRNDYQDALHYVDPPYMPETRSSGEYTHDMTTEDHEKLIGILRSLNGMVVLSGYDCDLYRDSLSGWVRKEKIARADSRAERTESIWLNPAAQARQKQQELFDLTRKDKKITLPIET